MVLVAVVCLVACWLVGSSSAARAAEPRWVAPLAGPLVVRRAFDPPAVRWGAGHRGADLASYPGAAVRAAGAGVVSFAGVVAGRGVLVVRHGALRTTYEPVRPVVPAGRAVAAGERVATVAAGHVGPAWPGESLLHWGLLRGDVYLDPLSLLRRVPSRLLPLAGSRAGAPRVVVPAALTAAGAAALVRRPRPRCRGSPDPAGSGVAGAIAVTGVRRVRRRAHAGRHGHGVPRRRSVLGTWPTR